MTDGHCFISYSNADALDFVTKLADELQGRYPFVKVWFDKREMDASIVDWDDQLANAIKGCKCLVFVMTPDSTAKGSTCKEEWTWALKYKKPVICLLKDKKAEVPFRLNNRQYIDISTDFDSGIAQLRTAIGRLDESEGLLDELNRRLSDANRDSQRAKDDDQPRIKAELDELTEQIKRQEEIVRNPKAAEEKTEKNIQSGLKRERKPELPITIPPSSSTLPQGSRRNVFRIAWSRRMSRACDRVVCDGSARSASKWIQRSWLLHRRGLRGHHHRSAHRDQDRDALLLPAAHVHVAMAAQRTGQLHEPHAHGLSDPC